MGSFSTSGALFLSIFLASRAMKASREQSERERRAQASQVSAWMENVDTPRWTLRVRNGSSEPVYLCVVYWDDPASEEPLRQIASWGVVPPETIVSEDMEPAGAFRSETPPVVVSFDDSAGVFWTRDRFGALKGQESWRLDPFPVRLAKLLWLQGLVPLARRSCSGLRAFSSALRQRISPLR